jgi:hypothetical protein
MIKNIFAENIMRAAHGALGATILGIAAILTLGCGDSTGPTTTAIRLMVVTGGEDVDGDPDGYILTVDGGPGEAIANQHSVTLTDLPTGTHEVRLSGVAPNCSVDGTNARSFDVESRHGTTPLTVIFIVQCAPNTGSIRVSASTSGPDQDPDGYSVIISGAVRGHLPASGTIVISGIRQGPAAVGLSAVATNCTVDGPNPRTLDVTFGGTVEVALAVRCLTPGGLHVTTATTGVHQDPDGYDMAIRLEGSSDQSTIRVSTNGSATVAGLFPGNYLLTLSDVAPNCDVVMPSPRVVAVASGSQTPVTLDISCVPPGELAYASTGDSNADIYIIAADGTGAYRITSQLASDVDPAWSPDGSRIAFTSERDGNREIYVMNANGTNPVRLTNMLGSDYRPAWSPDGTRIAFVSTRDGSPGIYLMNPDGTNPIHLTSNTGYAADPAWSPDGKKIAFSSGLAGSGGLWVMNADGSGISQLTTNTWGDSQPAWSPDGTRIAFSRASPGNSDIFIWNADGSGIKQLTHGIDKAADPSWSPDGRKIALGSAPSYCGWYDYYCDPYILVVGSADGLVSSSLTTFAFNPAWRP